MENEDPLGSPPYFTALPLKLRNAPDPLPTNLKEAMEYAIESIRGVTFTPSYDKEMKHTAEPNIHLPGTIVEVVKASNYMGDEDDKEIHDILIGQIGVITMYDPSDSTQTYFVSFNTSSTDETIKELLEENDFANNSVAECFSSYDETVTDKFVLFENRVIAKMDTRVGFWFHFKDLKVSNGLFPRQGRLPL